MPLLDLLFVIVCAVLLDTFWVAVFRARPVGRFKVLRDTSRLASFVSRTGRFTVAQAGGTLAWEQGPQRSSVKFSDIRGLEYRTDQQYALVEELFFGLHLTDLLPRYRDTIAWFSIVAVLHDGRRIPLYLSGQYQPREFLLTWYIAWQAAVLERLGLLADVEAQSRAALDFLQPRLGHPPLL